MRHTQEAKESETVLSRELCTERKKGGTLGFLLLSLCSYMSYILGLTVLGTVVREYGPETLQMSERGCCHRRAGKRGKAGRNSGNAQIVCVGVWGTGGTLLVLSGALLRVQLVLQRISGEPAIVGEESVGPGGGSRGDWGGAGSSP